MSFGHSARPNLGDKWRGMSSFFLYLILSSRRQYGPRFWTLEHLGQFGRALGRLRYKFHARSITLWCGVSKSFRCEPGAYFMDGIIHSRVRSWNPQAKEFYSAWGQYRSSSWWSSSLPRGRVLQNHITIVAKEMVMIISRVTRVVCRLNWQSERVTEIIML